MQADEEVGLEFVRRRGAVVEVDKEIFLSREDDFKAALLEEELDS